MKPENFAEFKKTIDEISKLNEILFNAENNCQEIVLKKHESLYSSVTISLTSESTNYGLDLGVEFVTRFKKHILDIINIKQTYLNTL